MAELLIKILIFGYAATGAVSIIGYIPTIKDLWHHKKISANISSYVIWTGSTAITFLYSLFVLPDLLFQIVSILNFIACAIILILTIWLVNRESF